MKFKTDDVRIAGLHEVQPPAELHAQFPIDEHASETVFQSRDAIHKILHGEDDRLVVVVGPCSIHDPEAAREYAKRLKPLIDELADDLCIIMRVYFEKPRTTVGWKGLINDPEMDESFHINKGLGLARGLLLDLAKQGIPAGTEFLDLISPQYIADLISWGAVGARTTESQGHRELASGLSCPIGFKNSTDGSIQVAVDAIKSAAHSHIFLSVTKQGHSAIFSTSGNEDCHIILRGGKRPNYDAESVNEAAEQMETAGLVPKLMVDCSHANSRKQHEKQIDVGRDVAGQVARGDQRIIGLMIESHLVAGRQENIPGQPLVYGQSITDACVNFEQTEEILSSLAKAIQARREAQ
mgnify:CR=1 FL=1